MLLRNDEGKVLVAFSEVCLAIVKTWDTGSVLVHFRKFVCFHICFAVGLAIMILIL